MQCYSAVTCQAPIEVSCAFCVMYYFFLFGQSLTKIFVYHFTNSVPMKDGKKLGYGSFKYDSKSKLSITLDRTSGNCIEQAIPFLTGLWLCAAFASPDLAAQWGWYWLVSRCIYPVCFYYGLPWLFLSTVPGYYCIGMLWLETYKASL